MQLSKRKKIKFQRYIFDWWEEKKRDLPWRRTHDPYCILVSEVMLQQTQVSRVLPKYKEFIRLFPTVTALARTSAGDVLRAWKGMGYNRRALFLQKAAQTVVGNYDGKFPENEQSLVKLPGLGKYTARAILVFAFQKDVAMVDTNIRQIITHYFFHDTPQAEKDIQHVADQLVPKGISWEWHQALMDYGSEYNSTYTVKRIGSRIKKTPFKETNRYYRGRILDILREGSAPKTELLKKLESLYGKQQSYVTAMLEGLEKDGLIIQVKGTISLPQ